MFNSVTIVIAGAIFVFFSGQGDKSIDTNTQTFQEQSTTTTSNTEEILELENFGLAEIAPYNPATEMSGDMHITRNVLRETQHLNLLLYEKEPR